MVIQRIPQWTPQVATENETEAGGGFRLSYILGGVAIAVAGAYLLSRR